MSKNLVFAVVNESQRSHDRGYDIGLKSWRNYCDVNNIHFFVYKHNDPNISPIWYRYRLFKILKSRGLDYNRIAYIDADTIISPQCPDLFSLTNKLGVVPIFGSLDWVQRGIENYGSALFPDIRLSLNYTEYFNAGIMLLNKGHEEFFDEVEKWRKENWDKIRIVVDNFKGGEDQNICNFLVKKYDIQIEPLSFKFNVQDLPRREVFRQDGLQDPYFWLDPMYGYIWHFNAIPNNHRQLMQEVYNKLWA